MLIDPVPCRVCFEILCPENWRPTAASVCSAALQITLKRDLLACLALGCSAGGIPWALVFAGSQMDFLPNHAFSALDAKEIGFGC